jgi:AraC-like DNA-binding protein
MDSVINTIVWAAVIQGLLLSLLYIFSKRRSSLANKLLGFFLLCFVIEALSMWLPFSYVGNYSVGNYFDLPEVKMFFPILFLHYVLEKLGSSKQFRGFLKFHYFIAILVMGITVLNLILFAINGNSIRDYFSWDTISRVFLGNQYYAFLLTLAALAISIFQVLQYKKQIKNEYSDLGMLEIKWLWQFIFSLVPITIMWGLELTRIALGGTGMSNFVLFTWGFIIVFIYFMSFRAFQHKNLFEGVPEKMVEDKLPLKENGQEQMKDYHELSTRLSKAMESKKYYLNQELTIHDLSKSIKISPRLLSTCINRNLGLNFTEWVNNYRVDYAIAMLKDSHKNHYSIEGIGADSGFKSRSAMYTAFKNKTGQTPGFFRKD